MTNMNVNRAPQHYAQQHRLQSTYEKMASGKKVNRAADGAAQMAIAQKIIEEYKGLDVGTRNMQTGMDVLNIADSAMSGVNDYLQRIDELSIQAANGTLSDSDRQSIQGEIDQMKEGIANIAEQTQFNGKKILDGSDFAGVSIATDGNSSVRVKDSANMTLDALGIKDYNVTSGQFDGNAISKALEKVSSTRSRIGAQTNRLEHGININKGSSYNQNASESRMMDTDYGKASSRLATQRSLQDVSFRMQRSQMDQQAHMMQNFML